MRKPNRIKKGKIMQERRILKKIKEDEKIELDGEVMVEEGIGKNAHVIFRGTALTVYGTVENCVTLILEQDKAQTEPCAVVINGKIQDYFTLLDHTRTNTEVRQTNVNFFCCMFRSSSNYIGQSGPLIKIQGSIGQYFNCELWNSKLDVTGGDIIEGDFKNDEYSMIQNVGNHASCSLHNGLMKFAGSVGSDGLFKTNIGNIIVDGNAGDRCNFETHNGKIFIKRHVGNDCVFCLHNGEATVFESVGNGCSFESHNGRIDLLGERVGDDCRFVTHNGSVSVAGKIGKYQFNTHKGQFNVRFANNPDLAWMASP